MDSDVIILAGGLGTRLKHLVPDLPKPMAPINNQPFLSYLIKTIKNHYPKRIILSLGYMGYKIKTYFVNSFSGTELLYSEEETPLGTGGAVAKAMSLCSSENVFIVNGDSLFPIDFLKMENQHEKLHSTVTIAVKEMSNFDRYGTLEIVNNRVVSFSEKKPAEKGFINGGVYLIDRTFFTGINWPEKFSLETGFLEKYVTSITMNAFISDAYFIDIGVPDDYQKAQLEFPTLFMS
ncbi:MAG: nucleotidyltransferase family protein [Prolixibacteraceae bacterium]|nr:nucleotidyltransferase family protein [Prolixibacteraceae bacterium]